MNARTLRESVFLVALVLAAGGAGLALAQTQAQPETTRRPAPKTVEEADQLLADLLGQVDATNYKRDQVTMAIRLFEARQEELKSGRRVAVGGDSRVVFMDRSAFNQSLLRHVTQMIIDEAAKEGNAGALGLAADRDVLKKMVRELEQEALRESEIHRQWLVADLAAARERAGDLMARSLSLWTDIERVIQERARLGGREAGEPRLPVGHNHDINPNTLSRLKRILAEKLEEKRKAGNWSADHHYQVGTLIGLARTLQELLLTRDLMHEFTACYDTKNLRRAEVLANARAGMYKTPGERIAALDEVTAEFNTCVGDAAGDFHRARARLSNPGK